MKNLTIGANVRINDTLYYLEGHDYIPGEAGEIGQITDYFPSSGEYEVALGYNVVYYPSENLDLVENVG